MTHNLASVWHMSHITRAWHHPDFDPENEETHRHLEQQFGLAEVVFDDPEDDAFLHIIRPAAYNLIQEQQAKFEDWRNLPRKARQEIYEGLKQEDGFPPLSMKSFEDFEELMRLDLTTLRSVNVDFDRFPYGKDNPTTVGIYRPKDGEQYYIGAKQWIAEMNAVPTFLTTEEVVAKVIRRAFEEVVSNIETKLVDGDKLPNKRLYRIDLDEVDGVYPVNVPIIHDPRARADGKKAGVSQLASSILSADENAIVIANGVDKELPRILTFQRMKGLNGLEERNIYIVLTWLAPTVYAKLNVLGQWLDCEMTVSGYYQDQINQAVGRNRGFRQSDNETKTVVICSKELWRLFLYEFPCSRVQFYLSEEKLPN
jgi:hypothetical protein